MAEEVGSIYYVVDAVTKPAVDKLSGMDGALDKLQDRFKKADAANQEFGGGLNKTTQGLRRQRDEAEGAAGMLSRLGAAMAAYLSIQAAVNIIRTADAYGEMAERIQMATKDTAEYNEVQRRLLANAQATYRPLAEAQELFVRTADTLRDMGYTTSQALDITDSLSLAFVRNAASGMRAESAISAVSKSLSTGKVAADQWESILAAVPTIIGDIANATGKTTSEIRELGAAGKLTGDMLAEGLRKGHDANAQAAAQMAVTVKDAYNNLINVLTVYIGKTNEASGATGLLAKAMEAFTKGFRFTVGMLEPHERLNELMRQRMRLLESVNQSEGTWRENMPGAVRAREELKKVEEEIRAIQDERVRQLKAESDALDQQANNPRQAAADPETKKALENLRELAAVTRLTGEERAKLQAVQKLGANATAEERAEAERLAVEIYNLTNARKEDTKQISEQAREQKRAAEEAKRAGEQNAQVVVDLGNQLRLASMTGRELAEAQNLLRLNEYATPEQIEQVKKLTAAMHKQQQVQANKELLRSADPMAAAAMDYEKQLTDLQTLNDAKLLSDQRYLELKAEAERTYDEQRRAMEEEAFARQSTANALLLSSLDALGQAGAQAMSGLLSGASNGQEAMRALANTILNTVIGTFTKMGAEWVKQQIIQRAATQATVATQQAGIASVAATQQAATASMAATTTATAASTGAAVTASMAPAAGVASIASFGGAAVAGIAALLAGMAIAKGISGGRQYGGPVAADGMYRINENGAPEVFNAANGRQYMLPNTRGEVVSNRDATAGMGGGGAGVVINVHNNANGATASATSRETDEGTIIDIVVSNIMQDGAIGQAISTVTGTERAGQ